MENCSTRRVVGRNGGAAENAATIGSIADRPRPGRGCCFSISEEPHGAPIWRPDGPSAADGKLAAAEHQKMGSPSQGCGGRCGARRRHHDGGSLPLLSVVGGRVPIMGTRVRETRSCGFAHYASAAISCTSFAPGIGHTPAGYYSCATEVPLRSKGGTPARARASQRSSAPCKSGSPVRSAERIRSPVRTGRRRDTRSRRRRYRHT